MIDRYFSLLMAVLFFVCSPVKGELEVSGPKFRENGTILLGCFDSAFSQDQLYEAWRSRDMVNWELENFYFGESQEMVMEMRAGGKDREFFRVEAVEQTGGGIGARGSRAALTEASFPAPETPESLKVELGRFLFWDKELSGNRNISCATCHHTNLGTGDALSLPIGEGGSGLGLGRYTGVGESAVHGRVPRNAPHLFALGHQSIEVLFHDGRLVRDPSEASGFVSPAGDDLPVGLESLVAAQAMFPVTSEIEMAGQPGENPIADFAAFGDLPAIWEALAQRLRDIPEYVSLFQRVYPEIETANDLNYVHAANAIGAYEAVSFHANESPFDQFLKGDRESLSPTQLSGMKLFYGKANCSSCHSGPMQTDQQFHAIAMPQLGPGKGQGPSGHEDWGRFAVTGDPADKFKFRTPTLRNVAITGPYGHSGAYDSLEKVVRHHLDPIKALQDYDPAQFTVPSRSDLDEIDFRVMNDPVATQAIAEANELGTTSLSEVEFDELIEFLNSLTDTTSPGMILGAPAEVPSGLPVAD